MDPIVYSTDTLTAIASISIAIAGFSGVVVALTGGAAGSFGPVERLNFRILLQVSALALFFSLLPLILHRAFEPISAWRISMLLYGVAHLVDAGFFVLMTRSAHAPSRMQNLAPVLGISIAACQLMVGAIGSMITIEVMYLLVLIWHLAIAGMGFVKLVFASRNENAT